MSLRLRGCGPASLILLGLASNLLAASPTTRPVEGIVLMADGTPAADVSVVLVAEGCCQVFEEGILQPDSDGIATRTDADGRFAFGPTTRPMEGVLCVLPDAGAAFAPASDVTPGRPLRLEPYTYMKGIIRIRSRLGAHERVSAWSAPVADGRLDQPLAMLHWTVTADESGRYRVPVVGGEPCQVGRYQEINYGDNIPRRLSLKVSEGATVEQDLGGGGRLVRFNTIADENLTFESATVILIPDWPRIEPAEPAWPSESIGWDKAQQEAFRAAWRASEAGSAAIEAVNEQYRERNSRFYYGHAAADGAVQLEDVLPGRYTRMIVAPGLDAGGAKRALQSLDEVTITAPPEDLPDEIQSLEDARLSLQPKLYAGDSAPEFDFEAFDGSRVRLSDHQGKWRLIHFWATWCGPCIAAMPKLKEIDAKFEGDARFVSVHVSLDQTIESARRFVAAERLSGVHSWAGPAEGNPVLSAYGADGIPTMVLVAPDGKVRISTHNAEQLMRTLEESLESPADPSMAR